MEQQLELADIPVASTGDLELLGRLAVSGGHGLIFFNGVSDQDREAIEAEFWAARKGQTLGGVAALVRFWCLVDVFASRRINTRFLAEGLTILDSALTAAAQLRLNAHWGFNPQRMIWALDLLAVEAVSTDQVTSEPARVDRRRVGSTVVNQLAA